MSGIGISYAPALLPDELLYSWLGRLAALNAGGAPRDVLQRFFGCRTLVPSVDLQTRLLAMTQQLGGLLPFTTLTELLERGTLLPYHRPFLTTALHTRVCHSLLHGDGKGLKTLMGRVANRFGANPALRSCPGCLADSWEHHGSLYWMRRHQLPGVNCCTLHGVLLQNLPLQARTHRQRLVLPDAMPGTQRSILAEVRQLRFAQLSQDLVEASLPSMDPIQRASAYRDAALTLGFRTRRNRVDFPSLADELRQHFNDFHGFDHQARLLDTAAHPLVWLRSLFDMPQRSLHPICHLLLIDFLFGSVAAFEIACGRCDMRLKDSPLGALSLIEADVIHASSSAPTMDDEAVLRDPSLSCRQVAAKIGRSVTTVVTWRRAQNMPIRERRKTLHPSVIDQVVKALGSLSSLPAVAARTGVSLSSVYRILAQYPSTPRPSKDAAGIAQVQLRRARWMEALLACQKEGICQVTMVRARASADYAWLYRHDRTWLASTTLKATPSFQRRIKKRSRVDWVRRDAELSQLLQSQIDLLLNETPPQRLTKTRLIRPLDETMVRRNQSKLPQLCALLDKAAESVQAFGMRRVDYAIALLVKDGRQFQLWRIQRLAGLRLWSDALTTYANRRTELLNAQNSLRPHGLP